MKINPLVAVSSFNVQNCTNKAQNVLNYKPEKLPQYNRFSFMASPLLNKYSSDFHGFTLLNQSGISNRNSQKYEKAIDFIQRAASRKLYDEPEVKMLTTQNPVIWSVTSEFTPVKEGGLGSVPPEIRNNAKKLGVSVPTFIPMYLDEESSTFLEKNRKYYFKRNNNIFQLKKAATFKMDTFKDGKIQTIPVEIYLYEDREKENQENIRQLIFVKADQYFDGSIYETNPKTEENEKFAVFTKAVYEFLKLKMEGPAALKEVHIHSSDALDRIKKPDGIILNDWQASPLAALMRYKAPMENAYNKLGDDAAEKIKNMTIATIGHNCMYQGSSADNNNYKQKIESSNNILNTLFDRYANDIVTNAKTNAIHTNMFDRKLLNLDNALILNVNNPQDSTVNFLNMGVILSDYFLPVSKNYVQELIHPKRNDLSHSVQWALVQKQKSNRMIGIINGNDYNNINIKAVNPKRIKGKIGFEFIEYDKNMPLEEIVAIRNQNKYDLYNNFMRPATKSQGVDAAKTAEVLSLNPEVEFYKGKNKRSLPQIDKETFDKTPVLSVAGRLVSQKGIDVAVDAIAKLYQNWDNEFPGFEKPIVYFGGGDNEGGVQRKKIEKLIDEKLSQEDASRVVFAHGSQIPINAFMAGSDFFLMPSRFEPCGLTQGESMAVGTPVIASAVGGIVDTVNRDGKKTGILTDKNVKLDADEFYSAIVNGLDTYFYEKDEYHNMIQDCLSEDFSWIQKGKKGPVYDYLELFGISRETLSDVN